MQTFYISEDISDSLVDRVHEFIENISKFENTDEEIKFVFNSPGGSV